MRDRQYDRSTLVRPEAVDPEATVTVVRVPSEWARWRVDRVVHATFPRMSRTRAQMIVRTGAYAPEGRKLRPAQRVQGGDIVVLYRPPFEEREVPRELPTLYEDDVLLAVDKPAGLPVHPAARWHKHTVTAILGETRPGERLVLCHRIDRETSGVLLVAKDRAAERFVKKALEERGIVQKSYLCIAWGVPEPREGRIDRPLMLDEAHRLRVKMRTARKDEPGAMPSATRYQVLGVRGEGDRRYALVRCELETGRQHQIRAHLASLGAPIVGDKLYGPDDGLFARGADDALTPEDLDVLELPRHALHAHRLALPHPTRREELLEIVSPLPLDLADFWDGLSELTAGD